MFWLRKSKCFEWKTMMVARVVNCEMFDDWGCANKWEWVSVNGSWIGLVSRRHEKPVLCLYLRFILFCNCCATPNNDILFNMMKEATLQKNTSWAGSESLWRNEAWNALGLGFLMLQLEILILYIAGPNFWFSCDERGVRMGVGVAIRRLKSWSVRAFTWSSPLNLFP